MALGVVNLSVLKYGPRGLSATFAAHPDLTRRDLHGLPKTMRQVVDGLHLAQAHHERRIPETLLRDVVDGTRRTEHAIEGAASSNGDISNVQTSALLSLAFALRQLPIDLFQDATQAAALIMGLDLSQDIDNSSEALLLEQALSHPPFFGALHLMGRAQFAQMRNGSKERAIVLRTWGDWFRVAAWYRKEHLPRLGDARKRSQRRITALEKRALQIAHQEANAWWDAAKEQIRLYGRQSEVRSWEHLASLLEGALGYFEEARAALEEANASHLEMAFQWQVELVELGLRTLRDGSDPIYYKILLGGG